VHARTVVVGNAANTVHPNGAQGLNLGLRDVAVLAHLLAPTPDVGAAGLLADYVARRTRDHRAVGGCTDLIAQSFRSRLSVVALGRRLSFGALAASRTARRALILEASGLAALARGRRA
jgi:2-octaprenyl-6-methoxyphenol hydroxylase